MQGISSIAQGTLAGGGGVYENVVISQGNHSTGNRTMRKLFIISLPASFSDLFNLKLPQKRRKKNPSLFSLLVHMHLQIKICSQIKLNNH